MLLEPDAVTYERISHSLDTPASDRESTSLCTQRSTRTLARPMLNSDMRAVLRISPSSLLSGVLAITSIIPRICNVLNKLNTRILTTLR
ncbi:hypothetical protein CEXT_663111 [Caerostris extrusa]|uniref:Uncharacterized protein n=1 Tax=Caerostris extrusa TaxID=172846 RepID=A0AAV4XH91_CAEEX|nr:hypothetical protein CEXT_663111 [Caerostris extrusa]